MVSEVVRKVFSKDIGLEGGVRRGGAWTFLSSGQLGQTGAGQSKWGVFGKICVIWSGLYRDRTALMDGRVDLMKGLRLRLCVVDCEPKRFCGHRRQDCRRLL